MRTKEEIVTEAQNNFDNGFACSQSVVLAFAKDIDMDEKTAKLISSTFGGGMGRLREKCGAVTGAFMVIGLARGNEDPNDKGKKLNAYRMVRDLNERVLQSQGSTVCLDLLKMHAQERKETASQQASTSQQSDTSQQPVASKHHNTFCREMVKDVAGLLYDVLTEGR